MDNNSSVDNNISKDIFNLSQNEINTLIAGLPGLMNATEDKVLETLTGEFGEVKGKTAFEFFKHCKVSGAGYVISWDKNLTSDQNIVKISSNMTQDLAIGLGVAPFIGPVFAAFVVIGVNFIASENNSTLGDYTLEIYHGLKEKLNDKTVFLDSLDHTQTIEFDDLPMVDYIDVESSAITKDFLINLDADINTNNLTSSLSDQVITQAVTNIYLDTTISSQYSQYSDMYYDNFIAPTLGAFYESTSNPENDNSASIADKTGVILDSSNKAVSESTLKSLDKNNDGKLTGNELDSLNLWTELSPYPSNIVVNNVATPKRKHLEMGTSALIYFELAS